MWYEFKQQYTCIIIVCNVEHSMVDIGMHNMALAKEYLPAVQSERSGKVK